MTEESNANVETPADAPVAATAAAAPAIETPPPPQPAPAPSKKQSKVNNPYIWGTGRRKASVARVRIRPGEGKFVINKREANDYFVLARDRGAIRVPLEITENVKNMDVFVNVHGGGTTGQAGAVVLGLARALFKVDPANGPKLKEQNLLSRDPRRVERKKYGQRGARRRFQFSKR